MFKRIIALAAYVACAGAATAQVNAVITDGTQSFAEGVLRGYRVQFSGNLDCFDPYVIGRFISCLPIISANGMTFTVPNKRPVYANTNGILGGMVVINTDGRQLCTDPMVWVQLRWPTGYIVCE
jgi:hypothetical protein